MKDFLSALRNSHRLLLVLSAGTILSAWVPRAAFDYWHTLNDLGVVESLEVISLTTLTEIYVTGKYRHNVHQGGVFYDVYTKPDTSQPDDLVLGSRGSPKTITRLLREKHKDRSISIDSATLSQIRSAFLIKVLVPVPNEDEMSAVSECIESREDLSHDQVEVGIEVAAEVDADGPAFDLSIPGIRGIPARMIVGGETCVEIQLTAIDYDDLAEPFLGWRSSEVGKRLSGNASPNESPKSVFDITKRGTWSIVEHRTISDAKKELERLLQSSNAPQPLGSFSLYRESIVVASPVLIIATLLMMLSHATAARSSFDTDKKVVFPWIACYSDNSSKVLASSSLGLLPPLALYVLFANAGISALLSLCVCVPVSYLGIKVWHQLDFLRSSGNTSDEDESESDNAGST
ncbi:MAG: hypothetical protein QNJ14_00930 [Woeseiaceae bacterium]|nr:hypothetical protein [Woeseiaceae bacterium]